MAGSGGPWGGGGSGGDDRGDDKRGGDNRGGRRPGGEGPQIPEIEEIVKKGQEQLRVLMGGKPRQPNGGGGGGSGGGGLGTGPIFTRQGIALGVLGLVALWGFMSFYTVRPEERSVELFLGEFSAVGNPGLNFAPWPFVTAEIVQVTGERQTDIGTGRDGQNDTGLMLTRDQNIVDIEFQVVWNITDPASYLFNLADPTDTIKAVSESAMRDIIARSNLSPILNRDRGVIASDLRAAVQSTLDSYNSGINVVRVNFDKADPPREVIDSFREVQAAQQERDRLEKEADAYANRVTAGARGESAQPDGRGRSLQGAGGEQRQRRGEPLSVGLYRICEGAGRDAPPYVPGDDGAGVRRHEQGDPRRRVGWRGRSGRGAIPAAERTGPDAGNGARDGGRGHQCRRQRREQLMKRASILIPGAVIAVALALSSIFIVDEREKALVLQFGQVKAVKEDPGLGFKIPLIQEVVRYDGRILGLPTQPLEVTPLDDRRLVVDAFARWQIVNLVEFRESVGTEGVRAAQTRLERIVNAAIREVLGSVPSNAVLSEDRTGLMNQIRDLARREAQALGVDVIDVRLTRTDLPDQNLAATYARMRAEREREATDEIARGNEAAQRVRAERRPHGGRADVGCAPAGRGHPRRGRCRTQRDLRRGVRARPRVLCLHPLAHLVRAVDEGHEFVDRDAARQRVLRIPARLRGAGIGDRDGRANGRAARRRAGRYPGRPVGRRSGPGGARHRLAPGTPQTTSERAGAGGVGPFPWGVGRDRLVSSGGLAPRARAAHDDRAGITSN